MSWKFRQISNEPTGHFIFLNETIYWVYYLMVKKEEEELMLYVLYTYKKGLEKGEYYNVKVSTCNL